VNAHAKHADPQRRHARPNVVAKSPLRTYHVATRRAQLQGDPEHAVCRGAESAEAVALFWSADYAQEYAQWKNRARL
jgi:hypothetical protein